MHTTYNHTCKTITFCKKLLSSSSLSRIQSWRNDMSLRLNQQGSNLDAIIRWKDKIPRQSITSLLVYIFLFLQCRKIACRVNCLDHCGKDHQKSKRVLKKPLEWWTDILVRTDKVTDKRTRPYEMAWGKSSIKEFWAHTNFNVYFTIINSCKKWTNSSGRERGSKRERERQREHWTATFRFTWKISS